MARVRKSFFSFFFLGRQVERLEVGKKKEKKLTLSVFPLSFFSLPLSLFPPLSFPMKKNK